MIESSSQPWVKRMSDTDDIRAKSFQGNVFLWLAVRHFLSASYLRELCAAAVVFGSCGAVSLDDLFDSVETTGPDPLRSWSLRPNAVEGELETRLQDFVRAIVWQGDSSRSTHDIKVDTAAADRLRDLWWAVDVGRFDLASVDQTPREGAPPEPVSCLLQAMRALTTSEDLTRFIKTAPEFQLLAANSFPLNVILTKHLGDLCVDADEWVAASALYREAADMLGAMSEPGWDELTNALAAIVKQSQAMVLRQLDGPQSALGVLSQLQTGDLSTNALAQINSAADLNSAAWEARTAEFYADRRTAVVATPQLASVQRHLGHAFEQLSDRRFTDANRWFWAGLRRQTAFGSYTQSLIAKAEFGRALIEQFNDGRAQRPPRDSFWLGVRLMIEGGNARSAELASWSDDAVRTHVDLAMIQRAIDHSNRSPAVIAERATVVIELFREWLLRLPRTRTDEAREMLSYLADFAGAHNEPAGYDKNLMSKSQKALKEVAKTKPDFRGLVAERLADLALRRVQEGYSFMASEVLSVALDYAESLEDGRLRRLIDGLLTQAEALDPDQRESQHINRILVLVEGAAARRLRKGDPKLDERVTAFELGVAVARQTESRNVFFLLTQLPDQLIKANVDAGFIETLVDQTRQRAGQINSSDAHDSIAALLSAPGISGDAGVRDALQALKRILETAVEGNPALSFGPSYEVLLMLADGHREIGKEITDPGFAENILIEEIWSLLLRVWGAAVETPEMFNGFMLPPPTDPNPVYVHNWAFASARLSKRLGREVEMLAALELASANPKLTSQIAVGRRIAMLPSVLASVEKGEVESEGADAFYAMLGHRLVLMAAANPAERGEALGVLLDGCIRVGPNGMDAAIFTAALEASLRLPSSAPQIAIYEQRLEAEKSLRLTLGPLFYAVAKIEHR